MSFQINGLLGTLRKAWEPPCLDKTQRMTTLRIRTHILLQGSLGLVHLDISQRTTAFPAFC